MLAEDRDVPGQGGRVAGDVRDRARAPGRRPPRRRYGGRPRAAGRGRPGRPAPTAMPPSDRADVAGQDRGAGHVRLGVRARAAGRPRPASRRTGRPRRRPGTARTARRRRRGRAPTPPAAGPGSPARCRRAPRGRPGAPARSRRPPPRTPMPRTVWSAGRPAIRQSSTSTTSCDRCLRIPRRPSGRLDVPLPGAPAQSVLSWAVAGHRLDGHVAARGRPAGRAARGPPPP